MNHNVRGTLLTLPLLASMLVAQEPTPLSADRLLDPARILEVRIDMAEADWDILREQTRDFASALQKTPSERPYTYFDADVTVDGVPMEGVRVRKKGFLGSLDSRRPSLKVRFKTRHPVSGIDRLTLNNNKQDRSLVSQYLGYRLFAAAGLPAPRCNLAKVTVNGNYLGVYSHVESVRAPFLKRAFGDASGALFEGTVADLFSDRLERFELKTRGSKRQQLEPIAAILSADKTDLRALEERLDVETFIRFWAMESLLGFWDGYTNDQNNYFIYQDPRDSKFAFIPWGLDDAFTDVMPIPPYRLKIKSVHGNALLPVRLYAIPETRELYRKTLVQLLESHWNEDALAAELDRMEEALDGSIPDAQADFPKALRRVRRFIAARRRVIEGELARWPMDVRTEPKKPIYFSVIGKASGTFSTNWSDDAPEDPLANGKAELELTIDGKRVRFKQLGVSAELSTMAREDPKPPAIVFTGKRSAGGKRTILGIGTSIEAFRPTGAQGVETGGVLLRTNFLGIPDFSEMRFVGGRIWLDEASMAPGAPVSGRFEAWISGMKGGE